MPAPASIPVYRSIAEIPAGFGPSVGAIGNFDGVHRGHRRILSAVLEEARALGMRAVAITFDPHPEHFLRPEEAPKLLTPIAERLRLLAGTGIDAVVVLPFDAELAGLAAREFVREILIDRLCLYALHEGGNFRFGCRAEAGVAELKAFGVEFGFQVHLHTALRAHGMEVSSSAVRELVAAGDVRRARWMLGRPFAVKSTPARGRGIGTKLLVPTVNLASYAGLLPGFGVYVTRLTIQASDGARCFQSVTNVGNRPTFEGAGFGVETHILDFEPVELSDETPVELEFLMRLRGEKTWPSPEALKAQIFKDVARAKRYFRLAGK
ncbi:MAG: riboflavin biosynthesis protein RibF [Terracidiphilus sp.]|jgi:riboflavin kinase/FMN adenylyltransferase